MRMGYSLIPQDPLAMWLNYQPESGIMYGKVNDFYHPENITTNGVVILHHPSHTVGLNGRQRVSHPGQMTGQHTWFRTVQGKTQPGKICSGRAENFPMVTWASEVIVTDNQAAWTWSYR